MPLSMHHVTSAPMKQLLTALGENLKLAEAHCEENGVSAEDMLNARLAPDMMSLTEQVQRATFHAAAALARLGQVDLPDYQDTETTFAELHDRVAKSLADMDAVSESQTDGSDGREVDVQTRMALLKFNGLDYVLQFALPQVIFHCTTAHGILRHMGVDIGKRNFLGKMDARQG